MLTKRTDNTSKWRANFALPLLSVFLFALPLTFFPFLYDSFEAPKWAMLYFLAILAGLWLVLQKKININFSPLFIWLALLSGFFLLSIKPDNLGGLEKQILDWTSFLIISVCSYVAYSANADKFINILVRSTQLSAIVVGVLGAFQFFGKPIFGLNNLAFASSTFGFQNMTAEFIGISLLLCVYEWIQSKRTNLNVWFIIFFTCYLLTFYCRSVEAALLASLVFAIFTMPKKTLAKALPLVVVVLAIVVVNAFPNLRPPPSHTGTVAGGASDSSLEGVKSNNIKTRLIRWNNTFEMIKKNPFGVGPGNFEFGYANYQNAIEHDPEGTEASVVQSPHNAYLELLAENGYFAGFAFLGFILFLAHLIFRKSVLSKMGGSIFVSILLFLCVDAVFAFPLEVPYPFFVCAIILGPLLFLTCNQTRAIQLQTWVFVLLLLGMGYWGASFVCAKYNESQPSFENLSAACEKFPSSWQACLHKAKIEYESSDFEAAYKTAKKIIDLYHNHYPAILVKGFASFELGKRAEGCEDLTRYDGFFKNQSSVTEFLKQNCSR